MDFLIGIVTVFIGYKLKVILKDYSSKTLPFRDSLKILGYVFLSLLMITLIDTLNMESAQFTIWQKLLLGINAIISFLGLVVVSYEKYKWWTKS